MTRSRMTVGRSELLTHYRNQRPRTTKNYPPMEMQEERSRLLLLPVEGPPLLTSDRHKKTKVHIENSNNNNKSALSPSLSRFPISSHLN
jgi:hypothetical protein